MTDKITAYLWDGRSVDVPRTAYEDWKYEAGQGDTHLGLGDWYTKSGDEHRDEIEGKPDDDPRCDHGNEGDSVVVTNWSQADAFDSSRSHASARVCGQRACVLDAMAWVERSTGEHAVWIRDADPEKTQHATAPLHARQTPGLPLGRETAAALVLDEGYASLLLEVPIDEMMQAASSRNEDYLLWDFLHERAFDFGATCDSSYVILAVQDDTFLVQYSTNVAEIIKQSEEDTE